MTALISSETTVRLLASIACILLAIVALQVRSSTRKRHVVRMRRLDQSLELMTVHSRSLEIFLADPASPNPLERVAIEFASLMEDRTAERERLRQQSGPQKCVPSRHWIWT